MKKAVKTAVTALVCFVLLFSSALAKGLEIGTDVSIVVERIITSKTEDCTLNVGGELELTVNASHAIQSYKWEISTDGGTSWTQAATSATYTITSAAENDPANVPYQYRVTVTTDAGVTESAIIRVLVSNDYANRTIQLRDGDTEVSAYMHNQTRLVVTPLPESSTAAQALEDKLADDCLPLVLYDVRLVNQNGEVVPYLGTVEVKFHVGSQYNNMTLRAFHLHDNTVTEYSGVVAGGDLTIHVTGLSPFMVEVPAANTRTVTASAGTGGSIVPAGRVNVADGADKTFTFLPDAGYEVSEVTVDGTSVTPTGNSYTLSNITANKTIAVSYRQITPTQALHTVSINAPEHGSVYPAGTIQVRHGLAQTVYFYPEPGYELDTVRVNGVAVNVIGNSYTLSAVTGDVAVQVSFRAGTTQPPNVYKTIAASAGANGSISPMGDVRVEYGGSMYFYFIPNDGYEVDAVSVDNTAVAVSGNFHQFVNVVDNRSISVTFKKSVTPPPTVYYTISASAGANGAVSPQGDISVAAGGAQTFYMIPNSGYALDGVYVDGVRIAGSPYQYHFSNVQANHTLSATFRRTATPPTGDTDDKLLWTLLIIASLLLAILCLLYLRKLKTPEEPSAAAAPAPQKDGHG